MCGIAGCVGVEHAPQIVMDGLEKQESRGYDSAGLAYFEDEQLKLVRTLGVVANLRDAIPTDVESKTAIGHNRWATHGRVAVENAHPHMNEDGTIGVVANGTVDNHLALRRGLERKGYLFASETDTEVIPHLLDFYTRHEDLTPEAAFTKTMTTIQGANAVIAVFNTEPQTLYAAKRGSPLVIGHNRDIGKYIASNSIALAGKAKYTMALEEGQMAILTPNDIKVTDLVSGLPNAQNFELYEHEDYEVGKNGYDTYMLKEINESADTVRSAISGRILPEQNDIRLQGLSEVRERLKTIDKIVLVGCGTSEHASMIGKRIFEDLTDLIVKSEDASEFQYQTGPIDQNTAVIAVSQSGETADTIGALRAVEQYGALRLGVINAPGTVIERETDAGIHCRAGTEVAVASTKAFTSQVIALTEVALAMSSPDNALRRELIQELHHLPRKVEEVLRLSDHIQTIAEKYHTDQDFMFIGRGYERVTALEGALKMKEVTYVNAQGYGGGAMKHGPIAVIDEGSPIIAIATEGKQYTRMASNAHELAARGGSIIALVNTGEENISSFASDIIAVPKTSEQLQPILNNIALQLFAYHSAVVRGMNVDMPRNLAKTVTVE